ncbi:HAD family hydrolase [Alkalicoccus luteus]|uniref:HAD family hydrolase n=1 Tax=Alkalicoccus luteus TaxID=1237094 RepID=A0A969TT67_9BACI|nr:HAD family hydrolase [Alkalicoccus luteus]NJP37328.1 HAD family hydrolase [Alkalicoccus luteus]
MKAVLFDLDGTMLPIDTETFVKAYMKKLAPAVQHLVHPEQFVKALWKGTGAMQQNLDPHKSNEQVFMETFIPEAGVSHNEIAPVLHAFYEDEFASLRPQDLPATKAADIVDAAAKKGYLTAAATNPVFPEAAVRHRLHWAGIDRSSLDFITSYENSSFTKPHTEYYEELCSKMGVAPEECIMVGNDVQEDIVAGSIGMKTYLVTGFVIDRGSPAYKPDAAGTLEDLLQDIQSGSGLFSSHFR